MGSRPKKTTPPAEPPRRSLEPAAREVVGQLVALAETLAPGHVRRAEDRRGWVTIEIRGTGKRSLPGGRSDLREHLVHMAYDGAFLQLRASVDGRTRALQLLSFPRTRDLGAVESFLDTALKNVRFGPRPRRATSRRSDTAGR